MLTGPFVLAEEGPSSVTLAVSLLFPGVTQTVPVTGALQITADGSGTLTLYSTITTEDGEATAVTAMVAEITPAAGAPAMAPAPRTSASPRSAC